MKQVLRKNAVLSDAAFKEIKGRLRLDLIDLQQRCRAMADFPVIVVLAGVRGAGVMDTLNLLNTWMDPRWIGTYANDTPSDEERERPFLWRYWRTLPAAGTTGLYLGGWYDEALRCACATAAGALKREVERVRAFEQNLADDGALIVKFWLHISEQEQDRRRNHFNDPLVGRRPSDASLYQPASYGTLVKAADAVRAQTDEPHAPWHVVEGLDDNHRRATVLGVFRDALKQHLKHRRELAKAGKKARKKKHAPTRAARDVLAKVDLKQSMSPARYAKAFHAQQLRLYELQKAARSAGLSTVLVFEGWDAAGKGGAIHRLTYALNARDYRIVPIAAPTEEERAHHYLWRFWRRLSRAGRMTIYDRSWYGRVLVERVERLISEDAWRRAYDEINHFEGELADHGTIVIKFWLHISRKEQLRRFEERAETPYKRWKLTSADWRNRKKRDDYVAAINDMVNQTSTTAAPWHLIPANDKRLARITVLRTVADRMEQALKHHAKMQRS